MPSLLRGQKFEGKIFGICVCSTGRRTIRACRCDHAAGGSLAQASAAMGFVSITLSDPFGYGRVVRSETGDVVNIVEEKDFDRSIKVILTK